jgi:cobyrinic acid a,c-diamide synthase
MGEGALAAAVAEAGGAELALAEGAMGLFDGAPAPGAAGEGSAADVAALTGWPVLLVLDVAGQAQSAGAVALGCARFRAGVAVAGVVLNRVASPRHEALARRGVEAAGLPVLGALPKRADLALPERHLGLVQAGETAGLAARLDALADFAEAHLDLAALRAAAGATRIRHAAAAPPPPPGQRIALAQDAAFSFLYPHHAAAWRAAGAEIVPFSPLADEAPDAAADVCWLPGGYPELHAGPLAAAARFRDGMHRFAARHPVHGECGGFMVLGAGLEDEHGTRHAMLGLLGLETSYARRRLHLGYRRAVLAAPMPGQPAGAVLRGHEFHYASILSQPDAPLAAVSDAAGVAQAETGAYRGRVSGTFFHLIGADAP